MPPDAAASTRDILICRHGETDGTRVRRIMGSLYVPLSDAGRAQCDALARLVAQFDVTTIVTSPLARAAETAEILARALKLEATIDGDLEEVRFGRWEGMTYDEIRTDPAFAGYVTDPVTCTTPGGETIADVQRRGLAAIARARAGERTLFVSHGDLIRSTLCHFLSMPLGQYRRLRVDNASLSALADHGSRIEIKFVNLLPDPARAWERVHWERGT
jgi:broad specificity phosphatase PhoE